MKTLILTKGTVATVDDEWYDVLSQHKWHLFTKGYAARSVKINGRKRNIFMHREIIGISADDKRIVDNIDGNKLNNCTSNLRVCDAFQNMHNRDVQRNNTSGRKGINWHKKKKVWQARIKSYGKRIFLGNFKTIDEAHEVYCLAADLLHGEFANYGRRALLEGAKQ